MLPHTDNSKFFQSYNAVYDISAVWFLIIWFPFKSCNAIHVLRLISIQCNLSSAPNFAIAFFWNLLSAISSEIRSTWLHNFKRKRSHFTWHIYMDKVRGRGIGVFDVSRSKILKSSIQSTQQYIKSSIFVSVFILQVYLYAHYQVLALRQVYNIYFCTTLNPKAWKINNASKKFVTFLRGVGVTGFQKNVHVTVSWTKSICDAYDGVMLAHT